METTYEYCPLILPVLVAQFKSKADLKKTLTTLLVGQLRFTGVTLGDEKKVILQTISVRVPCCNGNA